jgi:hypothetical protein
LSILLVAMEAVSAVLGVVVLVLHHTTWHFHLHCMCQGIDPRTCSQASYCTCHNCNYHRKHIRKLRHGKTHLLSCMCLDILELALVEVALE